MSEEYNLKKSEKLVGQLLPVILAKNGKVVDGLHRLEIDGNWKVETRPGIKTEEDYWKVRAHLNYSRRNAQDARQEKLDIIGNLADFYKKQGLKYHVLDTKDGIGYGQPPARPKNEIVNAVVEALELYPIEKELAKPKMEQAKGKPRGTKKTKSSTPQEVVEEKKPREGEAKKSFINKGFPNMTCSPATKTSLNHRSFHTSHMKIFLHFTFKP